jgi:hypothetical protein
MKKMNFRLLKADEIECRVATVKENGVSLLLYKDARVDQNILDETVGNMHWQRKHEIIGGNLFCSVGIFYNELDEWVWKQDVGTESYTEKEKGQASDAFKRACFNWGIGRELYTAPFIWVTDADIKGKDGRFTTYDRFEVKEIGYTDKKITKLSIVNAKSRKVVYTLGKKAVEEKPVAEQFIDEIKIKTLKADIENGVLKDEASLFKFLGVKDYSEITEAKFRYYVEMREKK